MGLKKFIVVVALAVALAAGTFLALRLQIPTAPEFALVLPAPNKVPEFDLVDQHDTPVSESVFEGQWDLVFFGFTHCPDVCPTTLQVLSAARVELAEK